MLSERGGARTVIPDAAAAVCEAAAAADAATEVSEAWTAAFAAACTAASYLIEWHCPHVVSKGHHSGHHWSIT